MKKRLLPALLALALVLTLLPMSVFGTEGAGQGADLKVEEPAPDSTLGQALTKNRLKFTPGEETELEANPDEVVRVSIVLEKPSTLAAGYSTSNIAMNTQAMSYRDSLRAEQNVVKAAIERDALGGQTLDVAWNLTLAANIISANIRRGDIEAVESVDGVKSVFVERRYSPDVVSVGGELDPDMAISADMTGASSIWDAGYTGFGSKIAIIDTGLDLDHQSFDEGAFEYSLEQGGYDTSKLMDAGDIEKVFESLNVAEEEGLTADALYRTAKVAYAWNYIDHNDNVTHLQDTQGEHGSHVAGIASANKYIPVKENGEVTYKKALDEVLTQGNAPDAQLLIMKVFGSKGGAYDSDCAAAIEDAILLGADAINLSLGTPLPGFSKPTDADDPYNETLDTMRNSDTVVVFSAGNAGAWADASYMGDLYNDGVSYSMGGTSGSYTDAFTVASVDNNGTVGSVLEVAGEKFGYSDTNATYGKPTFDSLDTSADKTGTVLDFVMLDAGSAGSEAEAIEGVSKIVSLEGKVVVLHRGGSSFYGKADAGAAAGAAATIVANNQPGVINMDLTGYEGSIPAISVTTDVRDALWALGEPVDFPYTAAPAEGEETGEPTVGQFVTGQLTVLGGLRKNTDDAGYYTMSDFSSWGVTGALEMKPEITAPGGSIWSVWGANGSAETPQTEHDEYEMMSGTSMAAPQITGISALVQQVIRDKGYKVNGLSNRALTQALIMSTAEPLKDASGNYYSLLQQGAGLARVENAASTPAVITVDGNSDGKVKAEIGDDPEKKGEYTFGFTIHNLTDEELNYAFSADMFTQAFEEDENGFEYMLKSTMGVNADAKFYVDGKELKSNADVKYDFNGDGVVDKLDAQLLMNLVMGKIYALPHNHYNNDVDGDGDLDTHDVYALLNLASAYATVPANGAVKVKVVVSGFKVDNATGGYVEGFVTAQPEVNAEGVIYPQLNFPVFGYYGSWTDPSMYEIGTADEWWDAYQEESMLVGGRVPYTADFIFDGQGNDGLTNIIIYDDSHVTIEGTTYGAEIGSVEYRFTPIRNYGNSVAQVTYKDADGKDHVAWRSDDMGAGYGVTYYANAGIWLRPDLSGGLYYNLYNIADIDWAAAVKEMPEEVTEATISVILAPEYYSKYGYDWDDLTDGDETNGELGDGAVLRTTVEVDLSAPEITEVEVDTTSEYPTVTVTAKDNVLLYRIGLISADGRGDLVYEFSPSAYQDCDADTLEANMDIGGPDEEQTVEFDGVYAHDDMEYIYQMLAGINNMWADRTGPLENDVYLLEVEDLSGNVSTQRVFVGMEKADHATGVTIEDVDEEGIAILKGVSVQLSAIADPVNLEDRGVTWSSKNPAIATVTADGVVTGVEKGTTTITATALTKGENGADVTADIEVEVFTIPVTATGTLGDEEGLAKMFTWDFGEGELTYDRESDESETIYPNALTRYEDNTILTIDGDGTLYQLAANGLGDPIETSAAGAYADVELPYDVTYSEKAGFVWTTLNYLLLEEDPFDPQYYGLNLGTYASRYGNIYAIAAIDKDWERTSSDGTTSTGDSIVYALTDAGYMVKCMLSSTSDTVPLTFFPLTSTGFDWTYDGYQGTPYSNMVIGNDGAFYISIMRNNTNEVVRLELEELEGGRFSYGITPMGDFGDGVWPALFLDVKKNADADKDNIDYHTAQAVEVGTVQTESFDASELMSASNAPKTVTGSLDTVVVDPGTEETSSGVVIDGKAKTVTVPVVADSTNGRFTFQYDTRILTLTDVSSSALVVTAHNFVDAPENADTSKPVLAGVDVGFAHRTNVNGNVVTLTFSFNRYVDTNVIINTTEEGDAASEATASFEIELSKAADRRPSAGGVGGGGGAVTPPPSTTEPSEPDNPGDEPTPGTPVENKFVDVPDKDWYTEAVNNLDSQGIMTGTGNNSFSPNQNIDRRSIATIIYRLAGKPETDGLITYTDVATGSWESDPIAWISAAGIMTGPNDTQFNSTKEITREELITVLWRYAQKYGYDVSADGFVMPDFPDTDKVDTWAAEAMCWAVRVGLIQGNGAGALNPTGTATRAEVAVMIDRFLKLEKTTATA